MAWQGRSVLFASKNNHAVDVVESRANELGTHPLLLRLGKEEHHARLAQHLTAALAESANPGRCGGVRVAGAGARGERASRFAAVQREIAAVVELRNTVDELERASEPARALFGAERFAALRTLDAGGHPRADRSARGCSRAAQEIAAACCSRAARNEWRRLAANCSTTRNGSAWTMPGGEDLERWERVPPRDARSGWNGRSGRGRIGTRWSSCGAATPLEDLARDLTRIAEESAQQFARAVAGAGCGCGPAAGIRSSGKLLSEYVSLLQMIATRRSLRRRRGQARVPPLLQPVPEGDEDPAVLGGDVALRARTAAVRRRASSTWW